MALLIVSIKKIQFAKEKDINKTINLLDLIIEYNNNQLIHKKYLIRIIYKYQF